MYRKYIGSGAQYNVYELKNGKVLKQSTTFFQKMLFFHEMWPNLRLVDYIYCSFSISMDMISAKHFVLKNPEICSIFGNPHYPNRIFRRYDFIQDKLIPLGEFINDSSFSDNKRLLMEYVRLILKSWEYGFSEKIFNFPLNCGVNRNGKIIMLDFGELAYSQEHICNLIRKKSWLRNESYKELSDGLTKYFTELMGKHITEDQLNILWKRKINS